MRYPWPRFATGLFLVALVVVCFFQIDVADAVVKVDEQPVMITAADVQASLSVEACEAEVIEPRVEISEVVLYTRVVAELVKTFYIA